MWGVCSHLRTKCLAPLMAARTNIRTSIKMSPFISLGLRENGRSHADILAHSLCICQASSVIPTTATLHVMYANGTWFLLLEHTASCHRLFAYRLQITFAWCMLKVNFSMICPSAISFGLALVAAPPLPAGDSRPPPSFFVDLPPMLVFASHRSGTRRRTPRCSCCCSALRH